ncbi:TRAP-type C4-dicarboxylate transport system, small permease component [Tistlia consotensis]|uniref:TRAP transporter small permease protein n=1 Tax=Tistlia consotensis USBA 355 TaxID=560819 RepID=A0A1Y6CLY6_9PROT|nr:TRAP transporter small permease subunit [Tistlia consotensis]SMF76507.1 TRAP-type C4-dicarboxylate transport system, small permease component [Tistlia consotensis USBA 355]SNS13103.1 TRAP-type C4-dicarboxylate transport system, small permease component [Tistlia consotensis]
MVSRFLKLLRRVEKTVAIIVLAVIVVVVFAGTIGRYSGHPVIWSDEVAQALFVWLSLLAGDLTLQRAGHFSVDLFAALLPARARLVLDVLILLLVGALLAALVVYGWFFVEISSLRPLPMTGVSSGLAAAALPVGFALMLVTLAEQLLRRLSGRPVVPPGTGAVETRDVL